MAHATSGPAAASTPFACIPDLDDRVARLPYRRRWPCPASHLPARDGWGVIRAAVEGARRWGAIGLFRLASSVLRYAMMLHRQRRISPSDLRTVLSATRLLERAGALLALGGRWRKRQEIGKERHNERID